MNTSHGLGASLLLIALALMVTGCSHRDAMDAPGESVRAYDVRGRVEAVEAHGMRLVVRHEEMPGYMQAMTMPFSLRESMGEATPRPGDAISFRYVITDSSSWIEQVRRLDADEAAALVLVEEPEVVEASDESLYQMDYAWTDHHGRAVRLADLAGRPVVLSMVFTHCGYACPMIVADMKRIAAGLPGDARDEVRYVLVSLDPERDTPEALRHFADAYGLNESWTLLRGAPDRVRMLAAMLGIRYRQQSDGQFAHTSLITVLNEGGEVVHRRQGTGTHDEVSSVLMDLLAESAGKTANGH